MSFYDNLKDQPIFVGFDNNKHPYGVDGLKGVSAPDALSRRGTFEAIKALGHDFMGVGLTIPIIIKDKHLVCLDFDWKRSSNKQPDAVQSKLISTLFKAGHAYEKSHSGYGCHFWVLMDEDNIPSRATLDDNREIEVFSGRPGQAANVLVTNTDFSGTLKTLKKVDMPAYAKRTIRDYEPSLTPKTEIKDALGFIDPTSRETWFKVACILYNDFQSSDDGFELFHEWSQGVESYNGIGDCRATWDSIAGYEGTRLGIGSLFAMAKENGYVPPVKAAPPQSFTPLFERDDNGFIRATQKNIRLLFPKFQLRYDRFKGRVIGVFDGVARPMEDIHFTKIQLEAEHLGFKSTYTKTVVSEYVALYANENSFDSAIEWGESLVWDGVPRCSKMLHTYFGAGDSEYTQAISEYMATAMAARLLIPGHQADTAIVLFGNQGTGKTSSVKAIAPEDTFSEIDLKAKDDDKARMIKGKLIVELAELRGLKSSSSEAIKTYISKTHEEFVDKYDKMPTIYPRRCIYIGTTNEQEFLNEPTENRRWFPITVGKSNVAAIKQDRDQLWAEAIVMFKTRGLLYERANELAKAERDAYISKPQLTYELEQYFEANPTIDEFHSKDLYFEVTGEMMFTGNQPKYMKYAMAHIKGWVVNNNVIIKGKRARGYKKITLL